MRRLISASLLAISSALPAMADDAIPATNIDFAPEFEGTFFTDCVQENLQGQFPDTEITFETRETYSGSIAFSIQAPFEKAMWMPDGVSLHGSYDDVGLIDRVTLNTRISGQNDTQTLYHPREARYEYFQGYSTHQLSQFSDTFRQAVEAIATCPTTKHESKPLVVASLDLQSP